MRVTHAKDIGFGMSDDKEMQKKIEELEKIIREHEQDAEKDLVSHFLAPAFQDFRQIRCDYS